MSFCPKGFVGELYIGGLGVARGYLRRPELTAERFVADPFRTDPQAVETLYRTGDLVRWLADDTVEFIGRADGQIKIRGFRIETGEIETILAGHEAVRACTVVGVRDPARGVELVAYVVATDARARAPSASSSPARAPRRRPAGLHGARALDGAGCAARDIQRQARPTRPAGIAT